MDRKIAFFFGAGVSIPAGFPSTQEITTTILNGNGVYWTPAGRFFVSKNRRTFHKQGQITSLILFLKTIKEMIKDFYQDRELDYEDLYYVINQLEDFKKEYENPIVPFFLERLRSRLGPEDLDSNYIRKMANLGVHYINDIVTCLLSREPLNLDYLSFIKEFLKIYSNQGVNIFTLNHDLLLETYFSREQINFCDGFQKRGELRVWQPELFLNDKTSLNLLKLHGSINWFKYREQKNRSRGYFFGSPLIVNSFNSCRDRRPLILTGRFNKILEYNRGIYVDLHYYFYRLLADTGGLVISGYSFRDKGINSWLIDWMASLPGNKILLISPDTAKCIKEAPPDIRKNWASWKERGRVREVSAPIEEVSWKQQDFFLYS